MSGCWKPCAQCPGIFLSQRMRAPLPMLTARYRLAAGKLFRSPYCGFDDGTLEVRAEHRVLDVGTGSGYQAAILAELAAEVISIERHPELAQRARKTLKSLGYQHIKVVVGDGSLGYQPAAPYDRILVAAAAPATPQALLDQLAPDGRLVLPVGARFSQHLEVWTRKDDQFIHSVDIPVIFVPLIGEEGWSG